jgi:hypothetical protein
MVEHRRAYTVADLRTFAQHTVTVQFASSGGTEAQARPFISWGDEAGSGSWFPRAWDGAWLIGGWVTYGSRLARLVT